MNKPPLSNFSPGWSLIALGWVGMLGILYVFFDFVLDHQARPNETLERNGGVGAPELLLEQNRSGHYRASGTINGQPVVFLLDTGATLVSVSAHQGPALGLIPGIHGTAHTANGEVAIRLTTIESLTLGPFHLSGIRAALNPGMKGDEVLLGMSVLKHLEFTQRGKTLVLRPHSP